METWLVQMRWDQDFVPRRILNHFDEHRMFVCTLDITHFVVKGVAVQVEAESYGEAQVAAVAVLNSALQSVGSDRPSLIRFEIDNVAELESAFVPGEDNVIELGAYMGRSI